MLTFASSQPAIRAEGNATMMRTRSPQHRRLACFDLYSGCTNAEINAIERLSTEIALPAGTPVWREDRTKPQFVMVLEGNIELTRAGDHIATLTPGTWFGHVALLTRQPTEQLSGVTVANPTRLLAFSRREFASLLLAIPTVAATLRHTAPVSVPSKHHPEELISIATQSVPLAAHHAIPRTPGVILTARRQLHVGLSETALARIAPPVRTCRNMTGAP